MATRLIYAGVAIFFRQIKETLYLKAFKGGKTPPTGWSFTSSVLANFQIYGIAFPGMNLSDSATSITTQNLGNPLDSVSFWSNSKNNASGNLFLEGSDGKK